MFYFNFPAVELSRKLESKEHSPFKHISSMACAAQFQCLCETPEAEKPAAEKKTKSLHCWFQY